MKASDIIMENTPKTLYHGTIKEFLPDIMNIDLQPSLGEFTSKMYDEYVEENIPMDELVFAADKKGLEKCLSAIYGIINIKGYDSDDFFKHAVLLVIKEGEDYFEYAGGEDKYGAFDRESPQIEPEDYYSRDSVGVDYYLTGKKLRNFLLRQGVDLTSGFLLGDEETKKEKMRIVIKATMQRNRDISREDAVRRVKEMSPRELNQYYSKARGLGIK